jgi:hypothetical protein
MDGLITVELPGGLAELHSKLAHHRSIAVGR